MESFLAAAVIAAMPLLFATLFVCFAFAILMQGASYIQLSMKVPSSVADVVQGVILFFVLGSDFFMRYSVKWVGLKNAEEVKF